MSSKLRTAQSRTYKASRTIGDIQAARKGRLGRRLIKRVVHRKILGLLRRGGLW
jgi:hypothetical protein